MKGLAILAALLVLVQSSATTKANDVPQHDVDASCAIIRDNARINDCIEGEQIGYDYLKSVWPVVPDDIKADCVRDDARWGFFFYRALSGCVRGLYDPYRREREPRETFQP